jgi:hypothetical protein
MLANDWFSHRQRYPPLRGAAAATSHGRLTETARARKRKIMRDRRKFRSDTGMLLAKVSGSDPDKSLPNPFVWPVLKLPPLA